MGCFAQNEVVKNLVTKRNNFFLDDKPEIAKWLDGPEQNTIRLAPPML
jgi:hypothetical protein